MQRKQLNIRGMSQSKFMAIESNNKKWMLDFCMFIYIFISFFGISFSYVIKAAAHNTLENYF